MKMVLLISACLLGVAGCATQNERPAPIYDPYAVSPGTAGVVVETTTTYSTEKKPGRNPWADWNFSTDRDRMSLQRTIDLQFPPLPQPHSGY